MLPKNTLKKMSFFLITACLGLFTYDHVFDIRLSNLQEKLPYNSEWKLKDLGAEKNLEVTKILNQPFFYTSEGGQSYVFSSKDNQYVLKLFKYKRFRPAWFVKVLPNIEIFKHFKAQHTSKRAAKLQRVLMGHQVAYEYIQEESGLVFVQLNSSSTPNKIQLIDKIGLIHPIDLSETAFVLQKKGEMLRHNFAYLLKDGQVQTVKERISQVFAMYLSEYQKGIHDEDHGVMQNFGFIGTRPFHLDLGKFAVDESYKKPEIYQPDLIKVANRIRTWMYKYYAIHAQEVEKHMEDELSKIFQKPIKLVVS